MEDYIDFGTIGIKIGDEIEYGRTGTKFYVASGDGTPGNGGTLLQYRNNDPVGLFGIRHITEGLLKGLSQQTSDVFSLWYYKGKTLREIHDSRIRKN